MTQPGQAVRSAEPVPDNVVNLTLHGQMGRSGEVEELVADARDRGFVRLVDIRDVVSGFEDPDEASRMLSKQLTKMGVGVIDLTDDEPTTRSEPALTTDTVRQYLNEIGRVDLLQGAQEADLAKRIDAGRAAAIIIDSPKHLTPRQRARLRTLERDGRIARAHLIESNLRLVVSVAKRYLGSGMPMSDLVQEGNLGLMRAVEKFDATRGYKFSTYATWWIRQMISRAIADQSRTIRLPVHLFETVNRLKRLERRLAVELGHEPTRLELAEAADLPVERVEQLKRFGIDPTSLDAPVGVEGDASIGDLIEDVGAMVPVEAAAMMLLTEDVNRVLDMLSDREQMVLERRFGLHGHPVRTLEQVGLELGLTRERIRQIEGKALAKLRHPTYSDVLQGYLDG